MKAVKNLPEGYREICTIDLQKNKKMALVVNLLAIVIAALLAIPMHYVVPISSLFSMENGMQAYMFRFAAMFVLLILYMIQKNLVESILLKKELSKKIKEEKKLTNTLFYEGKI